MSSLLDAMTAVFDAALEPAQVTSVTSEVTAEVTAFPVTKQASNPGNPGNLTKTVTAERRKVYRVLVAMDEGREPRWTSMLGCTDLDDARKSAADTFGACRVLEVRPQ